ncbi:DNA topoisomerase 1 [Tulasnella sp. 424]|nr:DNA topoisomerase 1 [Tulasnella sp. 424]
MAPVDSDSSLSSDTDGVPLVDTRLKSVTLSNGAAKRSRAVESEESELSSDDGGVPLAKRAKSNATESSTSTTLAGPRRNGATNGVNGTNRGAKRKLASSSSDDDAPLAVVKSKSNGKTKSEVTSDDDGTPLAAAPISKTKAMEQGKAKRGSVNGKKDPPSKSKAPKKEPKDSDAEDSDDDAPLSKVAPRKKAAANGKGKAATKPPKKKVKKEESEEEEEEEEEESPLSSSSDSDAPISRKRKPAAKPSTKAKSEPVSASTSSVKKDKVKKEEPTSPAKKGKKKKKEESEEAEDIHRWWEIQQAQGDGSVKWTTLEHNGVMFPPPYKPLPGNVKMKYDGRPITLSPAAEEVAGFFGALLGSDHAEDKRFQENFFKDWLTVLKDNPSPDSHKIKKFELCDFRPMLEHFEAEKAAKKALTTAEKKAIKAERDKVEEPYTTCLLDGRKEKVGNFKAEPPGLFRGRGEHPKKGYLKFRLTPEDITINIGENAKIPTPNVPGKWGNIVHDNTVTWLATWKENINGNFKYVFLAAGSSIKGQSDMAKFEKARELKSHVARIRQDYTTELRSKVTAERQRATAMYFIDKLALRAGNEKGEDEADTVGCCSLRYEHVTLEPPNKLVFDFLGKDSIRYFNTVEVDPQVFKNMRIFKGNGKEEKDPIFDRVTTGGLNKHLQSYMKGLTAKVFRTYNASITFQQQLDANTREDMTDAEKLAAYHEANRMVAILCNHQKSVSKTHGASMEKLSDKLRGLKYQRMKLRKVLFTMDPKMKKKRPELTEMESDLDDDFIEYWEEELKKKDIEKAAKKFEKNNEARAEKGEKPEPEKKLNEAIKKIEAEYEELKAERNSKDVNIGSFKDPEKVLANIEKVDERIQTFKINLEVKDKGKDVALGTSKINYLDPRITASWCKKYNIPIEKLFSKTLIVKFPWALEIDDGWKF